MNSKTITAIIAAIIILVGLYWMLNKNNNTDSIKKTEDKTEQTSAKNNEITDKNESDVQKTEEKYGELTTLISGKLSKEDVAKLEIVLKDREVRLNEIKEILKKAYETKDEVKIKAALEDVAKKREVCKGRLLPFISKDKKEDFEKYCIELGNKIKTSFENPKKVEVKIDGEKEVKIDVKTENGTDKKEEEKKVLDKTGKNL